MSLDLSILAPPVQLAIAHADSRWRDAFSLLLLFDDRLADVVGKSSEPIFAQMKIAWWRDVLGKPVEARPKGEPLVIEIARLETAGKGDGLITAMMALVDGWEVLAANEEWTGEVLEQFAAPRSKAIFGSYANWVRANGGSDMGEHWAVDDLRLRFGGKLVWSGAGPRPSCPKALRPLSILAFAARAPRKAGSGPRLVWHALTGR